MAVMDKIGDVRNIKDVFVQRRFEDETEYNECLEWCLDNTNGWLKATVIGFTFDNDDDALLFKLRWA